MSAYDRDEVGYRLPPDLEISSAAAAASAAAGSKDSYTKKIKLPLIKNKQYKFFFTYLHEDPETKEIKESDRSPVWTESFTIPNLTKGVLNLTLTPGSQSYGIKFDLDPTSVQEDVVIFESLTSNFATQTIVYTGTSTNVSILTTGPNAFSPRWVKVRSRDKWDDLNISEVTAGPVTPFSADVDTTYTVENPASSSASASIDPKDLSGFSLVSTISWAQSTNVKTAGYAIRWSTDNPSTVTTPLWEYASVSGIATTSFTATGLIPNTTYYYQVASTTPYDVVNWTGAASGTIIASDADGTAAGALARLKSFIAIGGASQDLFKIGTGISQSINLNTDPIVSPTLTAGTYHGIILNKSTTNVGNNFWLTTGQFRVGNPTEFMYWNGTNLYLTGSVNATGGKFTGNVQLAIPAGASTSGTLFAGANPTSGARVRFSSEGIFAYDATSTDNATGQTFSLVQSTGRLNANLGTVGGWTLATTGLSSSNTKIENDGNITLGNQVGTIYPIVRLSATDPNYRLWVGSNSASTAKFRVSKDGILSAEGAVIGLGAGSTIPGYVEGAAIDFTLKTVTNGINQRLAVVEGDYVPALTLSTGLATKNTVFVTTDSTQPFANKAGDLWINGGDQNSLWTATGPGQNWTEKPNGKLALKTSLNAKLNASTYIVQSAVDNKITADATGLEIFSGSASSGVKFTGSGLYGYKNSLPTFSIDNNGNAQFAGDVSATSGYFGTSLSVGWMISGGELLGNTPSGTGYSQISLNANTGTISGGKITGTVLQGSLIRTSTNSRRVEMSDASDSFRVLNSGYQGHITGLTDGIMMHYTSSSTPSSTATAYGLVLLKSNYGILAGDSTHYFEANGVSNIVNIMGTVININAGSSGIVFSGSVSSDRGKVYFEKTTTGVLSPSTTTSSANTFLNSSTGLIARSTSSRRYKTNIESVEFTDDQLLSLRPVKFQGISDLENGDNAYRVGLIAEEVAEIQGLEDIVEYNEDGNPENISYNSLAPILISVVKRVLSRLDALEAK